MKFYKHLLVTGILSGVLLVFLELAPSSVQSQDSSADSRALTAIVSEVQAQQKTIADNQAKIDEKLAAIAEQVRQARIYAGRGR